MKITLRLIFFIVLMIALGAAGFAYWHAQQEEQRLKNELERRASVIADSLKESIQPLLPAGASAGLQRIVNKFATRERLLGVAVLDLKGDVIAASEGLGPLLQDFVQTAPATFADTDRLQPGYGAFVVLAGRQVHTYSILLRAGDKATDVLTLFHDRTYITEQVMGIWINSFWRALIQSFLIALTTLIIIYLSVMTPLRRTTDWIRRLRRGEPVADLHPRHKVLLGPLAGEIAKMAKSLELARLAAEEEARLRQATESLWTPERLKEFVKVRLEGRPLFVVSNREPYMHVRRGKEIECRVPASGMVTAIEPVLEACGGTWIAHGSGDADQEAVDAADRLRVPPEEPQYTLRRVWISREEEAGYYYGFANEGLWPLCHIAHTRPIFREENWLDYKAVNEKFARVLSAELQGTQEPCVLIQDYHFALLSGLIKQQRPDARVAIFWHIPWPNPESFGICPWRKELLLGMLGADLVGFHTQFHCNNFVETVDRFLESRIDYERFTVHREGQTTWVKPFPISIAFTGPRRAPDAAAPPPPDRAALLKPYGLQADYLGVGVDRLDYTKGILERLRSIEHFLVKNPAYQGKFTFVQLGAPSRSLIPKYQAFVQEVEAEVERINGAFKAKNWKPILFLKKHHSHQDILPFYQQADVCLVTSLHDGMNLVAKEFVAARDDERGVLILSQFTGAARELADALIVNPYDVAETSAALRQALEMPAAEQTARMRQMRAVLKDWNIYRWAGNIVLELARIRLDHAP